MTILELKKALQDQFHNFEWTVPPDLSMGILTTNEAFKQAQRTKSNPVDKALEIAEQIQKVIQDNKFPCKVSTTGPYINLSLTSTGLGQLLQSGLDYTIPTKDETIFLDYFSPNVGKQMHIGHMRSANIGESLRRVLSLAHPKVITDNHIADWGIQFSILIWGIQHITKLKLSFSKMDWDKTPSEIVGDLNQVYVATNAMMEADPSIREQAQAIAKKLETNLQAEKSTGSEIYTIWQSIVEASNQVFSAGEGYLHLNENQTSKDSPITTDLQDQIQDQLGVWQINTEHLPGQFDLILGESFYQTFLDEVHYWHDQDLLVQDEEGYYMDLEEEGLGRAYLISSAGYSVYVGRDSIARFVWAGLFNADLMVSIADNRQNHSFKQAFAVIQKVLEADIYRDRPFGLLTQSQTDQAIANLQNKPPVHVGFGFMSLASGAMSTRKGTVIKFDDFTATLEAKIDEVLSEKDPKIKKNPPYWEKVQKISTATIKWFDLSRDKDQDIVFDIEEMLSFEGNTGIYQLYTYARITNILQRTETTAQLNSESITLLNQKELEILNEMYTLPNLIEQTISELKPHLLANHLVSLTAKINSWYAAHSVAGEESRPRRDAMLAMLRLIQKHLDFTLNLLGIETMNKL